jgi:hypothetical protein
MELVNQILKHMVMSKLEASPEILEKNLKEGDHEAKSRKCSWT